MSRQWFIIGGMAAIGIIGTFVAYLLPEHAVKVMLGMALAIFALSFMAVIVT